MTVLSIAEARSNRKRWLRGRFPNNSEGHQRTSIVYQGRIYIVKRTGGDDFDILRYDMRLPEGRRHVAISGKESDDVRAYAWRVFENAASSR